MIDNQQEKKNTENESDTCAGRQTYQIYTQNSR